MSEAERDLKEIMKECPELRLLMSDYLDDLLDEQTRARIDAHVAVCPNCPTLFRAMLANYNAVKASSAEDVPDSARRQLYERLKQMARELD
ncbi:MAG TPA: zf-HC2 domain-containing protein [Chloroflexia bacterium]|nr:zf-HC2 domain-containing protein [Chloroflexia bacterium]